MENPAVPLPVNNIAPSRSFDLRYFILVVAILFLGAAVLVGPRINKEEEKDEGSENLQNIPQYNISGTVIKQNEAAVTLANKLLSRQLDNIKFIGERYANDAAIVDLIENGKWAEAIQALSGTPLESQNQVTYVFFADIQGNLKADFPMVASMHGENFAFQDWHKGVTKDYRVYLSEIYRSDLRAQHNVVSMAFPIKERKFNTPIGVLVLQIELNSFYDWLHKVSLEEDNRLFIVDQYGQVVAHSKYQTHGEIISYWGQADIDRVVQGGNGSELILLEDKYYISSFSALSDYGWSVVMRTSADSIEKIKSSE